MRRPEPADLGHHRGALARLDVGDVDIDAAREVLQSHFGAATLKADPEKYLAGDFAALLETMALAAGVKVESENKPVPTGLE